MLRSHHQDVAPVAIGDHLLLQVLRRLALAQERLEGGPQPAALLAQPVADAGQRRTGIVGHLAARLDLAAHVRDLVPERGDAAHQPHQKGQCRPRLRDRFARLLDRLEEIRQAQQPQRLERAALGGQPLERGLEFRRCAQREPRVHQQEPDSLRGRAQRSRHARRAGDRRQRLDFGAAHRRHRQVGHDRHDAIELERAQGAGVHGSGVGRRAARDVGSVLGTADQRET